MTKRFGELLSHSWAEYKGNFKLIFRIFFILYIIPSLAVSLFSIYGLSGINEKLSSIITTEGVSAMASLGTIKEMLLLEAPTLAIFAALILISTILGFIMSVTFIHFFLHKKKGTPITSCQAIKSASKYLGKYILLVIFVSLVLMALYMLFIIPGVIFTVYWIFAAYVLIGEKAGIIESIKRSKQIVSGRWWRVFGYYILLMLVFMGVSLVFSIPGSILRAVFQSTIIASIFSLASYMITIPLGILFLKNFYLDLKAGLGKK